MKRLNKKTFTALVLFTTFLVLLFIPSTFASKVGDSIMKATDNPVKIMENFWSHIKLMLQKTFMPVLCVLAVVVAGIKFSFGTREGKRAIYAAIIGTMIVFGAILIVNYLYWQFSPSAVVKGGIKK